MRKMNSTGDTTPKKTIPYRALSLPAGDDESGDLESDLSDDDGFFFHPEQLRTPQVFSPTVASTGRADDILRWQDKRAEQLGCLGAEGGGLYLVLHADDIHSPSQLLDALRGFWGASNYYTDTLLGKLVKSLRHYGQLVVFGTMEVAAEVGPTLVELWLDKDRVASARIGALLLERVARLTKFGMFCSILTRDELMLEQRAVVLLQWMSVIARSCDPMCQTVAECILPNRHLVPLLRADFKMSARVTKAWYSLLLTLLAVPTFKSHLAAAYCDTYRSVTAKYARGMGVLERSGYTLSVQFLNRVTYVIELVRGRDLFGKLGKALLETLLVAGRFRHLNGRLDPNHFVLTHRRYSPCISDLKCVLNVRGMPRLIACQNATFLEDWIQVLSCAQFMDPQSWRHWSMGHVEEESRGWVGAFNLSISLGSLFDRLLGWDDDEQSPIKDPASPLSRNLMSCVDMTYHILVSGVAKWQQTEMIGYEATLSTSLVEPHMKCPQSLPFSSVAMKHGTALAMRQLPVAQITFFSFHLPLHRFVAGCIRELCSRLDDDAQGVVNLLRRLGILLTERESDELFRGLMEFPLLVLSRAAQIRAGLWRRNGPGINDQVLNYSEPPFCRTMRDADLLVLQFSVLGRVLGQSSESRPGSDVGMAFFTNLLLHRLGVFEFCGLTEAPKWNLSRYFDEIERGLYPPELKVDDSFEPVLPWSYSSTNDAAAAVVLLEEFLYFVIVFCSELPYSSSPSTEESTRQAKTRLYREVIHRLASGPKTHSELSEVHHVLSHHDNVLLSEEGKKINPDDATGAVLGVVLSEVAQRKGSQGKLEPDKWELKRSAWDYYDPSFYHISLRSHQSAAENRPKPVANIDSIFGWKDPKPYAPQPTVAHPAFQRLRRDITADATALSVVYRTLHLHCRENIYKSFVDLPGKAAYDTKDMSETALARAIHLLTLGIYSWRESENQHVHWRDLGGGSVGSIFFDWSAYLHPPSAKDWLKKVMFTDPGELTACDWYRGEENIYIMLRRLALDGGGAGGFVAQDASVRSGAAWLCKFALDIFPEASELLKPASKASREFEKEDKVLSEVEERQKRAKEAAMARMKAQAEKFAASLLDAESEEDNEDSESKQMSQVDSNSNVMTTPNRPIRSGSFGSNYSSGSSVMTSSDTSRRSPNLGPDHTTFDEAFIPPRMLKYRPRCIICNDEDSSDSRISERTNLDTGESQPKKSKRRAENALGFVGYVQPSTVLKGGGGPPPDFDSQFAPVGSFVGSHIALCGHAVHSECCESYLATVSHREDRTIGKRDDFRCPLCQRLSNCLIPFIDCGVDWIDSPRCLPIEGVVEGKGNAKTEHEDLAIDVDSENEFCNGYSIHDYLLDCPWWLSRHNDELVWDGHCAFLDRSVAFYEEGKVDDTQINPIIRRRLKKRDLYAAWNSMMRTPRFVRRRLRPHVLSKPVHSSGFTPASLPEPEESTGETIVWRRFMDQVCDLSYRADTKRLGEDHLHDLFGEFRHYIVEKYAFNMANKFSGGEPVDVSKRCKTMLSY